MQLLLPSTQRLTPLLFLDHVDNQIQSRIEICPRPETTKAIPGVLLTFLQEIQAFIVISSLLTQQKGDERKKERKKMKKEKEEEEEEVSILTRKS